MVTPPPGNPPTALPPSVVAAEQRAREFLAQTKWRKARDELKPLVKIDRARYLPLIIQANLGLVRELMAKGQVADAQPILAYLATIAPTEQLRAVELEMAGKTGNQADILPRCLAALCDASNQLPPSERCSLADQAILTFQEVPEATDPAHVRLAAEVRTVQEALLAISMQQWERGTEVLRGIPHRSVFSHWAMFLRGIMAFHRGDTERAVKCFAGLPPKSVPAKASQAYLLLAGRLPLAAKGPLVPEAVLDAACRLAGYANAGRIILRAEQHWRSGNYADSYRTVRDAVAQFPTESSDWLGALTDYYFAASREMAESESYKYTDYFDGLLARGGAKNGVEEMLMRRMFALKFSTYGDSGGMRDDWERYLTILDRLHRPNPRRSSIGYGWLGEQLARSQPSFNIFGPRTSSLRDAKGALAALQKAIALDPNNLPAHLALTSLYGTLNKTSERNRLLDDMSERFPEEKPVLLEAARRCLERKAFVKGLDLLERARHLDRIDPVIPELMVTARLRHSRQYFQQKRAEKGRQTLAQNEEFLTDRPEDFQRSRWTAKIHHGVLERLYGEAAAGETLLAEARALSPFPAAFALFAHLTNRACAAGRGHASLFLNEWQKALKDSPSVARALLLRRQMEFWIAAPEKLELRAEEGWLRAYVKAAAKAPFTRDEARQLIEIPDNGLVYESPQESALLLLVKKVLRNDPQDPLFRLYEHTLTTHSFVTSGNARAELESILEEAVRRRDDHTTQKVRQMLKACERPPFPLPPPPEPDFGGPDDFEDDLPPPGFADLLPPSGGSLPDESPELDEMAAGLLQLLSNASEADLRVMRKTRPKDMPESVFDSLVESARKMKGLLPPPQFKPPRRPDPNQPNLF